MRTAAAEAKAACAKKEARKALQTVGVYFEGRSKRFKESDDCVGPSKVAMLIEA